MSKTLTGHMTAALADKTTYLVRIWKLELSNGSIFHFTDANVNVIFDGDTYIYDPGILVSAVQATVDGQQDNAQIEVRASAEFLTKRQIRQGLLDLAGFELKLVDWRDPDHYGAIDIFAGSVIDVSFNDKGRAAVQLDGNGGAGFERKIGETYSRLCRAVLGDSKCTVDIEALKTEVLITTVSTDGYSFTSDQLIGEAYDAYYSFGKITFTTGENTSFTYETAAFVSSTGTVTLSNTPRAPLIPGDALFIYPGCDKQLATCKDRYDNLANHRAEPYALNQQTYIIEGIIFANDGGTPNGDGTYDYKPIGGGSLF